MKKISKDWQRPERLQKILKGCKILQKIDKIYKRFGRISKDWKRLQKIEKGSKTFQKTLKDYKRLKDLKRMKNRGGLKLIF